MNKTWSLVALFLAGCPALDVVEPYYAGGPKPKVVSLDPAEEDGNVGGSQVVITGNNFGDDPSQLMVQFGSANAEILSVSDTELVVTLPDGPMSGGAVDVVVASPKGYAREAGGFTYNVGSIYENQRAYVQINNFIGSGAASTLGMTLDGDAQAFTFDSPRFHAPGIGFWGASDVQGTGAQPEWKIEQPAVSKFPFGVDKLHAPLGDSLVVYNEDKAKDPNTYCILYEGDTSRVTRSTDGTCDEGTYLYTDSVLNFCTFDDAEGIPTETYSADWPLSADFFGSARAAPVNIRVEDEEIGLNASIVLPEPAKFSGEIGFVNLDSGWSTGELEPCYTDDVAFGLSWTPSEVVYTEPGNPKADGAIVGQVTYVQITVDLVPLGWFGINTPMKRAILTVPDSYKLGGGLSHVEVPASVMDQFPSIITPGGGLGGGSVAMDTSLAYGYLFVSAVRVTDYAIHSKKLAGDVVVSYATGDVGLFSWTNPKDGCN